MQKLLLFSFLMILTFGCSQKEKQQKETSSSSQKVMKTKYRKVTVEEVERKRKEKEKLLNRKNTVSFLEKYGEENPENLVLFKTRLGNIKVKLYTNTPLHRASFIFLAKQGYFNTVCVHRIVEGFVVQGGNSENPKTRKIRKKFDSYTLPSEFRSDRKHKYGALAAARNWTNNPNKRSTPFEFYFVQDRKGAYHLDGEHTVYGEIVSGFDTLDKIAKEKTDNQEWPKNDVFFEVEVLQ